MNYAKKDPTKGLHKSEMHWPNVPLDLWVKFAAEFDPEGGLPCDQGQLYNMRPKEEWSKMDKCLGDIERNVPYAHPGAEAILSTAADDGQERPREEL